MDLRKEFFKNITELAFADPDVILLTGDLGYSFCEEYQRRRPGQFINCGIAEQNMVGMAAGLALGGKKPYVYSNAIFLLMRAYEQVRDDVAYNNLPVKLIGTGAAGFLGFSHNLGANESEPQLLNGLPNIMQFYPMDEWLLKQAMEWKGPAYIRL